MKTVKFVVAMGLLAAVAGCASVPETSSRFNFSPAYSTAPGLF